jgi:ethanolamine utilization protein EutA
MTQTIKLVGLDCGSTTTNAVVAAARLTTGALGRVEITDMEAIFRSEMVFTPLDGERIDAARLEAQLDHWLVSAGTKPEEIFGGGALITGLAAQRSNARSIAAMFEARLADAVIAVADDPRMESWLAFMGNCLALSKARPQTPLLNIDIGGGTTNLALGIDGQVVATGALYVGARHFRFEPGTYRLSGLSAYATDLLEHLKIDRRVGDTLERREIDAIIDFYIDLIVAGLTGNDELLTSPIGQRHIQVPLRTIGNADASSAVTLSGGVGQLVYQQQGGGPPLGITHFGDLGGELAERIVREQRIVERMQGLVPEGLGRATVYGLLRHSTELSGSTLYLPHPERLPLKNVPIVGRLAPAASDERWRQALALAAVSEPAACLQIELAKKESDGQNLDEVRALGTRLAGFLQERPMPAGRPLVVLVPANLGKVLGNYITQWSTLETELIVIDEVPTRDAQFVRLGRLREGVVPLWLYAVR